MEKSKAVSEYIYKDEFCFVTQEGTVFRKGSSHQSEKEIGQTDTQNIEENIAAYRSNFVNLEEQINDLPKRITEEEYADWKDKLQESNAIGEFDRLYSRLDDLKTSGNEGSNGKNSADSEKGVKDEEQAGDNKNGEENGIDDEKEDPAQYYKKLTKEAQKASKSDDWQKVSDKLSELSHQWSDGPEMADEEAEAKVKDLYYKFTKAEESFQKRKEEHFTQADKKRKENLSNKRSLLKDIEKIVQTENWSATGKIRSLEGKWNNIGSVPKEQASEIQPKYQSLIKEFKSHKVDRLVEKRQKQEDNLMMKMVVLDKMENVASEMNAEISNWKEVDEAFADLTSQWKKIGRVPREKSNQVWSRYKAAQDAYYDNKYKYDKDHRSNVDSFTAKKENIIADAEALVKQQDIAKAARKVNKLHRRWKKIGNLPQRKEDELWDRFKAATDAFNQRKADNTDKIEEQENEHYRQKLKLIEKAEEAKGTSDWDKGHKTMQRLMDQWKKVGPVPRKKSGKIWKQFKGAMDVFYDRRREHFKEAKEQQKENLKKKEEILEKLQELGRHEDPIEAVNDAKKLQSEFKDIGYVPIKKKNEMWKRYREVCDVIYDRMRAAKSGSKFDQELAKADLDPEQRSKIQDLRKKYKNVKNEVRSLKKEVLQLEESKTNFNFSGKDNPFRKEMTDKIDKARAKLDSKQNKLDALSMEMEDIRGEA